MPNDYAKMTAELIARMSRPRTQVLCSTCQASTPAGTDSFDLQCPACSADDSCDDIELEAAHPASWARSSEVAYG